MVLFFRSSKKTGPRSARARRRTRAFGVKDGK
jgi:hypothetical protein